MKGPYEIEVRIGTFHKTEPDLVLTFDEMFGSYAEPGEAALAAYRYRRSPDATLRGTETLGQFYVALLLDAGEEAWLTVVGTHGGERSTRSAGSVRRDEDGRAFLTNLNSKWGTERHFIGL
jgi:hypothetical protein